MPRLVFQRSKVVVQQRESPDVPVIFGFRNGRLQQNANRSVHRFVLPSIRSLPSDSHHCGLNRRAKEKGGGARSPADIGTAPPMPRNNPPRRESRLSFGWL